MIMPWPTIPTEGIRGHGFRDARQFIARPPVVAVQERNDLALGFGNPGVEGGRLPAIRLADQPQARLEFADDIRRAVG